MGSTRPDVMLKESRRLSRRHGDHGVLFCSLHFMRQSAMTYLTSGAWCPRIDTKLSICGAGLKTFPYLYPYLTSAKIESGKATWRQFAVEDHARRTQTHRR